MKIPPPMITIVGVRIPSGVTMAAGPGGRTIVTKAVSLVHLTQALGTMVAETSVPGILVGALTEVVLMVVGINIVLWYFIF